MDEDILRDSPEEDNIIVVETECEEPIEDKEDQPATLKKSIDPSEVSEEELDKIADTAIEVLQSIFEYFDVGSLTIDEYIGDEGELILDIAGDDLAILIGRHGKTLEALQYILSAICFRKLGYRFPVIVDVEGYRSRLREKLESMAHTSANRAASTHRNIRMRPMNPCERRIIHMALRDDPRVETKSDGEGVERHVVIYPL